MSAFPLDYWDWKPVRDEFLQTLPRVNPEPGRFPGKNLFADAILGWFAAGDHVVELSDVTFPGTRHIGVTVDGAGLEAFIVDSFEELQAELDRLEMA